MELAKSSRTTDSRSARKSAESMLLFGARVARI